MNAEDRHAGPSLFLLCKPVDSLSFEREKERGGRRKARHSAFCCGFMISGSVSTFSHEALDDATKLAAITEFPDATEEFIVATDGADDSDDIDETLTEARSNLNLSPVAVARVVGANDCAALSFAPSCPRFATNAAFASFRFLGTLNNTL